MDVLDIHVDEATLEFFEVRLAQIRPLLDATMNKAWNNLESNHAKVAATTCAAETKPGKIVNRYKYSKRRSTVLPYTCRVLRQISSTPKIDFANDY